MATNPRDIVHGGPTQKSIDLPRKRRPVKAACSRCREKRVRCDGGRPVCTNCSRHTTQCVYPSSDPSETHAMILKKRIIGLESDLDRHGHLIKRLRCVPHEEALQLLAQIRDPADPLSTMFSTMEEDAGSSSRQSPVTLTDDSGLSPGMATIFTELPVSHPMVYTPLAFDEDVDMPTGTLDPPFPDSRRGSGIEGERRSTTKLEEPDMYRDPRLQDLDVAFWTTVKISRDDAVGAISFFLQADHAILGLFDANNILDDLSTNRLRYCTPFLCSALLCLACQIYSRADERAFSWSLEFLAEAEGLWPADASSTSPATIAAMGLLQVVYTFLGKEEKVFKLLGDVKVKARYAGMFDVPPSAQVSEEFANLSVRGQREKAHAAWGAYNWASMHAMYFHEAPILYPPNFPPPASDRDASATEKGPPSTMEPYISCTFTALCGLWPLVQEIATVRHSTEGGRLSHNISLAFAESRFQKLLDWSDTLSADIAPRQDNPNHVLLFQGLFHCVILDLFWPFVQEPESIRQLQSFNSRDADTANVFQASVTQLKYQVRTYVSRKGSCVLSGIFNTTLVHLNSILFSKIPDPEWQAYFTLTMLYLSTVVTAHPVYAEFAKAYASMAMSAGLLDGDEALRVVERVERNAPIPLRRGDIVSTCLVDLVRAQSVLEDGQVRTLTGRFEELKLFQELTNIR